MAKQLYNENIEQLSRKYEVYSRYFACGLVGEGSECYGFDDEISKDHDLRPDFNIWLPEKVYKEIGRELQNDYENLDRSFCIWNNNISLEARSRRGVSTIEGFFNKYTNCGAFPKDNLQWLRIPERFLSIATNGIVFMDSLGEFSKARKKLLDYYPEDVRVKKIVARIAVMSQSGQYNYPRSLKRQDEGAAYLALSEFVKATLSVVYLLNKEYMPFYKWAFRKTEELTSLKHIIFALRELIYLGDESLAKGETLSKSESYARLSRTKTEIIECICSEVGKEINRQGISNMTDTFLQNHCQHIMENIKDNRIRNLHIMADFD